MARLRRGGERVDPLAGFRLVGTTDLLLAKALIAFSESYHWRVRMGAGWGGRWRTRASHLFRVGNGRLTPARSEGQNGHAMKPLRLGLALAVVIAATGCLVQSFYPFCREESKVPVPELTGDWQLVTNFGDDITAKNLVWTFESDKLITRDEKTNVADIGVAYFKTGGQLFCDSWAGDSDGKPGWYWLWHVRPVHTVSKVELKDDVVKFRPLDLEWLTNKVSRGEVKLASVDNPKDSWPLFICKTVEWEKFLAKYAADTNAFPDTHIYVLKKQKPVK